MRFLLFFCVALYIPRPKAFPVPLNKGWIFVYRSARPRTSSGALRPRPRRRSCLPMWSPLAARRPTTTAVRPPPPRSRSTRTRCRTTTGPSTASSADSHSTHSKTSTRDVTCLYDVQVQIALVISSSSEEDFVDSFCLLEELQNFCKIGEITSFRLIFFVFCQIMFLCQKSSPEMSNHSKFYQPHAFMCLLIVVT